jgi:hypothetical protein
MSAFEALAVLPLPSDEPGNVRDTDASICDWEEQLSLIRRLLSAIQGRTGEGTIAQAVDDLGRALHELLSIESHRVTLLALKAHQAVEMLDTLQIVRRISFFPNNFHDSHDEYQWLDAAPVEHAFHRAALHVLVKLSAQSTQLPRTLFLPHDTIDVDLNHRCSGGFADVYLGKSVAIKQPRFFGDASISHMVLYFDLQSPALSDLTQKLCREALIWRQMRHPFILPFIGIGEEGTIPSTRGPCLLSPWMNLGTLLEYTQSPQYEPQRDICRLVSPLLFSFFK